MNLLTVIVALLAIFAAGESYRQVFDLDGSSAATMKEIESTIQIQVELYIPEAQEVSVRTTKPLFSDALVTVEVCTMEEGTQFCSVFPGIHLGDNVLLDHLEVENIRNVVMGPKVVQFMPSPDSRYYKQEM